MMLGLYQLQALECSYCGNLISDERAGTKSVLAVLLGYVKYGICPLCLEELDPATMTPQDKRRWTMLVKKMGGAK